MEPTSRSKITAIRLIQDPARARLAVPTLLGPRRAPPRLPLPGSDRKRGAPVGNTNALKHGYYASRLGNNEADEIQAHKFECLEEEKQMIRFFIRRVLELGKETENLEQAVALLRVMTMAATTLARITRTEKYVGYYDEEHGSLSDAMKEILADMTKNL